MKAGVKLKYFEEKNIYQIGIKLKFKLKMPEKLYAL